MESMLRARLRKAIEEGGGLSEEQHGFREGRVVDTVMDERDRRHDIRDDVLLVTLDIKNAFDSATWENMIRSLEQHFRIPSGQRPEGLPMGPETSLRHARWKATDSFERKARIFDRTC